MSAPINVAIIDDDERMLRALARLVRSVGMKAATFATAHEFLDAPIREDTDCVITDMRMPG